MTGCQCRCCLLICRALSRSDPTVPSNFNARDAAAYEQVMGRWSRRLAPLFIDFAGVGEGERLIDVGCGTGSLAFALLAGKNPAALTAVDYSELYLDAARAAGADPRLKFEHADACALPFDEGAFDRALSLLVLHFVPRPELAVAEMRRVVRRGGGVGHLRRLRDAAHVLGYRRPSRSGGRSRAGRELHADGEPAGRAAGHVDAGRPYGCARRDADDPHGLLRLRRFLGTARGWRRVDGQIRRDARPGSPRRARARAPLRL